MLTSIFINKEMTRNLNRKLASAIKVVIVLVAILQVVSGHGRGWKKLRENHEESRGKGGIVIEFERGGVRDGSFPRPGPKLDDDFWSKNRNSEEKEEFRGKRHHGHKGRWRRWLIPAIIGVVLLIVLSFLCGLIIGVKVLRRCLRRRNWRKSHTFQVEHVNHQTQTTQANQANQANQATVNPINEFININSPKSPGKSEVEYPKFNNFTTTSSDFSKSKGNEGDINANYTLMK